MKDKEIAKIYSKLAELFEARATVQREIDARNEEAGRERYDTRGLELLLIKVQLTIDIDNLHSELIKNL